MKTASRLIVMLLVCIMLINLAGCYGSFALTKKLYNWNGSLGDKFINTAVMWVFFILPVYNIAGFIDLVVLNTIEFWTNSNPVTMQEGEQKIQYVSNDGKTYKIVLSKNNMYILETVGPDKGKFINLSFSPETGNWVVSDGTQETVVANMSTDNLKLFYPNGESRVLELSH